MMLLLPNDELFPGVTLYPNNATEYFTITDNIASVVDLSVKKEWPIDITTSIDFSLNTIINLYPIMGYVYEPADIPGQQVQVQTQLNDFYYQIDTEDALFLDVNLYPGSIYPDMIKLYAQPQPLSQDTTNDRYRPYRLK